MDIVQLVSSGETEKAIEAAIALANKLGKSDLEKAAINLSSQFSMLEKQLRNFSITRENASVAQARINNSLLGIADELGPATEEDDSENQSEENSLTKADVEALEEQQILDRLQKIMKRKKFFQDQFDISSDASQKFNLQENIDQMEEDIALLKAQLS